MKSVTVTALRVVLVIIFAASASAAAIAGTTGIFAGKIVGSNSGKPLPGVRVHLVSPSGYCATQTNAQGIFSCMTLPPDTYTLSIEKYGYMPLAFAGFPISADVWINKTISIMPMIKCQCRIIGYGWRRWINPNAALDLYSLDAARMTYTIPPGRIEDDLRFTPGVVVIP